MASSEQLEREAEDARTRVERTLDELRARTTPGHLVDQLIDYANGVPGGAFARNLSRQVVDNPLPVALLGVSLVWLALAGDTHASRGDGEPAPAHDATARARNLAMLIGEQPIALAGIGVALGALLEALVPGGANTATGASASSNDDAATLQAAELGHA
jgi:uncharacterized protein DUF3618